jgi:hypothetical protein
LRIPWSFRYKLFFHTDETIAPTDLTGIDARSVKKLRVILSLSVEDCNDVYRIVNKMLRKSQLEQREKPIPVAPLRAFAGFAGTGIPRETGVKGSSAPRRLCISSTSLSASPSF